MLSAYLPLEAAKGGKMRRTWVSVAFAVVFAGFADYLLYGHFLGAGLAVFMLLVGAAMIVRYRRRAARAMPWAALWLVVALGAALQPSALGAAVVILLGWSCVALAASAAGASLLTGAARGAFGALRAFVLPLIEAVRRSRLRLRFGTSASGKKYTPAWVAAVPVFLVAIFAVVMLPANLVIAKWLGDIGRVLQDWLGALSVGRVFFWGVVGLEVFALMRFAVPRLLRRLRLPAPRDWVGATWRADELKAAVATFAALNVLYLAVNLTDAAYLWFALKLPAGLTYAEFAQRGSYRLIAAVVMAAVTLCVFFRVRALQSRNRVALALAYVFVAQNLLVLVGAARRLQLYVDVYGLTRLRVAAFIWMALVAVGFITIVVKLRGVRPFSFLLRANAASVAVVLAVVTLLDINGFIAGWNVERYERGMKASFDVAYIGRLGATAMPALARLTAVADADLARDANAWLRRSYSEAKEAREAWQARTLRTERAIGAVEARLAELPYLTADETGAIIYRTSRASRMRAY